MSLCAQTDIRNLEDEFFNLDELKNSADIAKAVDKNIQRALKGDELQHSVSEANKVMRVFGVENYDKWVDKIYEIAGDKISTALGKGASKITKAFGVPLDDKKVESFFKAGVHTKLMDKLDHSWGIFNQRLYLNSVDNLKKLQGFSKDEISNIYEYLHGWKSQGELAEHTRAAANSLKNIIAKNADTLVELGVLRAEDKIENYVKHYFEPLLQKSEAEIEAHFNKIGLGEKFKRKELSKAELEELGLMKDEYAIINTIREQFIQIEKARRLQKLADRFSSAKPVDGWVRFGMAKGEGGKEYADSMRWGALAGRYVSPELDDAIKSAEIVGNAVANSHMLVKAANVWMKVVAHLKTNLTVKNPATHAANYISNMITAAIKGDLIASQKMAAEAVASWGRKLAGDNELTSFDKWRRCAHDHGLSMITDELDLVTKAPKDLVANADSKLEKIWKFAYMAKGSKTGDFMRALYNMEDGVFKLAHFKKIMEKERINGEKFDIEKYADLKNSEYRMIWKDRCESAMNKANYEYVDYSTRWNGAARYADRLGFAPFLQYTWKSVPMVAKNILKNPHRYAAIGVGIYGLGGLSLIDREQKDARTEKWARNGNFLWLGGRLPNMFFADTWVRIKGTDLSFNLGRVLPGARLGELSSVFNGGFITSFFGLMQGKTSLGHNFIKEDDNTAWAVGKIVAEAARSYLPSMTMGRYAQGFGSMAYNEVLSALNIAEKYRLPVAKDGRGKEISAKELVMRAFAATREMRVGKAYQENYNKALKDARNARKDNDLNKAKELESKAKRIKGYAKAEGKNLKEPRK